MHFPGLPKQRLIPAPPHTPFPTPTLTGLVLYSENNTSQKELPHLPIRKPSNPPIPAPTLCLHVGPGSHLCHLLKSLSVSSLCSITCSLSASHPSMAGGMRAQGSPIISKPLISTPLPAPMPFSCSPSLQNGSTAPVTTLSWHSVPKPRDMHIHPRGHLGSKGQWSTAGI